MNKTSDQLLGEIGQACHNKLSDDHIKVVADEVRAHLDASIQARMELGLPQEEAETQAVAAFGDVKKFVHALTEQRAGPRVWHGLALGALVAVSIVMFGGPDNLIQYDGPYQECTAVAFVVACIVAAMQGWRWSRASFKTMLLGISVSIPIAMTTLSAMYISFPGYNNVMARRELAILSRFDPIKWQAQEKVDLDKLVTQKLAEFDSHAPPYRVPRSTLVPEKNSFRTARSREEAVALLEAYREKVESKWPADMRMLQLMQKSDGELLNTPLTVNAVRMWPRVDLPILYLWIIVATCHLVAAAAKTALRPRIRARFLLRPVLEIGLDDQLKHATPAPTSRLSLPSRLIASHWIDKRVFVALLFTMLLTGILIPIDTAAVLSIGFFVLAVLGIGYLSWFAKRPQFIPLIAALVFGIAVYVPVVNIAARSTPTYTFMRPADAIPICAYVVLIVGAVSTVSWLAGSLWRRLHGRHEQPSKS